MSNLHLDEDGELRPEVEAQLRQLRQERLAGNDPGVPLPVVIEELGLTLPKKPQRAQRSQRIIRENPDNPSASSGQARVIRGFFSELIER